MRERFGRWVWTVCLCAAAAGCACPGTYYYGGNGCGVRPLSGRHIDGGATCDGDCGSCDSCVTNGPSRLRDVVGCNSGCGRMYWGEWAYDPPDACDPCDDCGNWAGPQDCPPRGIWCLLGLLHGYRSHDTCGTAGCTTCGSTTTGGCNCGEGVETDSSSEEIWSDSSELLLEPTAEPAEPVDAPVPRGSVLRESRRVQPNKPTEHKSSASRVVRRGRVPDMH